VLLGGARLERETVCFDTYNDSNLLINCLIKPHYNEMAPRE